jgi:hypothetical protein
MNQKNITVKFNKKIIKTFIFLCLLVLLFLYGAIILPLNDENHSEIFYRLGGIFFTIIFLPILISYGKFVFLKRPAFFFDDTKFIYNNPLEDVPNPILWGEINKIEKIELGNYKFIAVSFYDNQKYINKLNLFWRYMANFRLKKFGFPLLINKHDMTDLCVKDLLSIFHNKYENYRISNKT